MKINFTTTVGLLMVTSSILGQNKIESTGNVGIGTSYPESDLHIKGNRADLYLENTDPTNWAYLRIKGSSNYFWDIGQFGNNDFIEFRPNGQSNENRTVLMQNGNMGIGTITPTKKLDVNGAARIGNITSRQYLKVSSKEWPELRFETPTSNEEIRLGVSHSNNTYYGLSEGDFYVYSNTVNKMPFIVKRNGDIRLNTFAGNVGIGTTFTGNHKLAVEGSIGAREVKVEASGWSDFVFEQNYHLPTLEEVEHHIKKYGHLKDIPSASEVEKNGIFLGAMDAKLLQKIEELTLYTIQQEKKIQQLETENKQLYSITKRLQNIEEQLKIE